jgi:hypothetical protein
LGFGVLGFRGWINIGFRDGDKELLEGDYNGEFSLSLNSIPAATIFIPSSTILYLSFSHTF